MGLFRKKKPEIPEDTSVYQWMTVEEALSYSRGERKVNDEALEQITGELCGQMNFLRSQQEDTKYEYNQVTQYLADIQRLERLDERERGEIADAARMMLSLDAERLHYQNGERRLSTSQYHIIEMYEDEFPDKLSELEKKENYLTLVRDDMRNLEGEKGSISYGRESAESKRKFLNKLSYVIIFAVLTIFIVLLTLANNTGRDFVVPFFITGLAAIIYMVYYIYATSECKNEEKRSEYMMNRANVLLNKVKIKFVNTTNALDYSYEKYHVNSLQELRYVWENYVAQKDEDRRYLKNTKMLNSYTERLFSALTDAGMEKPDAWIHQPEVLLNRDELFDFKDAISRRRNKLRAQMDYNMRQQDTTMNEIEALKCKYASHVEIIDKILAEKCVE